MLINLHHITSPLFLSLILLCEPFSILWMISSQWVSANISASVCLWFSIWPTETRLLIYSETFPLRNCLLCLALPCSPYSNHIMYYLLANLQRKVEDRELRKGRGRSGWIFILQFCEILFFSNWKMSNPKKSQGILPQIWASLIFMVSSMSKIEPNVPH